MRPSWRQVLCSAALGCPVVASASLDASGWLSASNDQLAFTTPRSTDSRQDSVLKIHWETREGLEKAVRQLEEADLDVWFAGRRGDVWEAVIGFEDGLVADATTIAMADEAYGPPMTAQQVPVGDRLSTSLPKLHSAAILRNLSASSLRTLDVPMHDAYHPYENIHEILVQLEEAYPDWLRMVSIGKSSEGRDIWGIKVSNMTSPSPFDADAEVEDEEEVETDDEETEGPEPLISAFTSKGGRSHKGKRHKHKKHGKLGFVVAGTQHAREWIAASTILYLIHDLVVPDASGLTPFSRLLNAVEFTFVPVVNPDGYVYSWDTDRLWRKSRQPVGVDPARGCFGIDLNRNWGYKFQRGTRPNPCSDSYPGAEEFESVELQALRNYLLDDANHVDAFLDVHSFGQMLLFPYSYSCDAQTPDQENHYEAVLQAAKALRDVHGRQFETGSVCEVSLTSPGESLDWTYAVAKIRWSFATELRDIGVFGFLLPPSQIRPSGEEMSAALRSLTQFILDKEAGKR
ncbi:extracellular matrix protein 14 [Rhodotorula toruloides]|uniref:Inactive metallocarboxypeptidase ECM14 n=1 Tax=Rhodotorula toruloides TaxID=5286 RepID=A0A511KC80_RHOTO|nr:extracellular matrix protein 14 [Rhodotorula toruloides]